MEMIEERLEVRTTPGGKYGEADRMGHGTSIGWKSERSGAMTRRSGFRYPTIIPMEDGIIVGIGLGTVDSGIRRNDGWI